jgi:hypothetical protein
MLYSKFGSVSVERTLSDVTSKLDMGPGYYGSEWSYGSERSFGPATDLGLPLLSALPLWESTLSRLLMYWANSVGTGVAAPQMIRGNLSRRRALASKCK